MWMKNNSLLHRIASGWSTLLDIVYPRHCLVCQNRLTRTENQLCVKCLYSLPTIEHDSFTNNMMVQRFWGLTPAQKATALFFYHPASDYRNILHTLKYAHRPEVGVAFGRIMAQELIAKGFFQDIDAIIPVPLSKARRRQRGYNQSECLAHGIAEITGIPVWTNVLIRTRDNTSQTRLRRQQRIENVEGIFQVHNTLSCQGKHILLVDDVMTTGATLLACGEALKNTGCKHISFLCLAWTQM